MGIKDPVSFNSSISENFSIVGFLNSTLPVFLISGLPDNAIFSSVLYRVSMY